MSHRWQIVRWSVFAAFLVSTAIGLYVWLPPAPRWVVRGQLESLGFSPDGKILRTQKGAGNGAGNGDGLWLGRGNGDMLLMRGTSFNAINLFPMDFRSGPVQLWDPVSGREIRKFLEDVSGLENVAITPDGRTMYAVGRHGSDKISVKLHKIDLDTGADTEATVEMEAPNWRINLSTGGKLVLLDTVPMPVLWNDLDLIRIGDGKWHIHTNTDPQPEPRILRLHDAESLRLAVKEDGRHWEWRWAPDGDALLLYAAHDNGKATLRRVTATDETITILDGAGTWRGISPDGKTLFTSPPASEADEGPSPVLLWDTATGKRCGELRGSTGGFFLGRGSFGKDGRLVVCTQDDEAGKPQFVLWDLEAQKEFDAMPQLDRRILESREHGLFLLYGQGDRDTLAMYRPQPFAKLWQRDLAGGISGSGVEFVAETGLLRVETGGKRGERVLLLDIETGETRLDVTLLDQHRLITRGQFLAIEETIPIQTDNRGWFWETIDKLYAKLAGAPLTHASYKTITRVFDTETGTQLGRLDLHGAVVADLSPDGGALFMQEDDGSGGMFCCYDVPASLRWAWIIGLPACLGAVSVTGRTAWRSLWRWRTKQRAVKVVA